MYLAIQLHLIAALIVSRKRLEDAAHNGLAVMVISAAGRMVVIAVAPIIVVVVPIELVILKKNLIIQL